jgi:hypothetical protein
MHKARLNSLQLILQKSVAIILGIYCHQCVRANQTKQWDFLIKIPTQAHHSSTNQMDGDKQASGQLME